MKPIIKWAGGKGRLLPEITERLPKTFGRYFEPFAGGAALFFSLAPERAVLADANADLINLYRMVATYPAEVIAQLDYHRVHHCEAYYYGVRARWNDRGCARDHTDRAAAFIYLNKTCFNGLWRVNRAGQFNVPFGKYANPKICDPEALLAASAALARADLRCADYRVAVDDAERGDFVYFDPPYDTTAANFTSYTADAFGRDQQRELAGTARALDARGCHVMVSSSDTIFIRALYKGFRTSRVKCARAINSNAAKRGAVNELIIVNY